MLFHPLPETISEGPCANLTTKFDFLRIRGPLQNPKLILEASCSTKSRISVTQRRCAQRHGADLGTSWRRKRSKAALSQILVPFWLILKMFRSMRFYQAYPQTYKKGRRVTRSAYNLLYMCSLTLHFHVHALTLY